MGTEISHMFDNDSCINSLKEEYTYDENGNLLTSIRYYLNGTDWMANYKEEYDYNNASVLVSYTASRVSFFDNSWMVADHIKYEYDEDNLLITEQPYSLDMETEDWIIDEYGNVISYVYDSNGNLISGTKTVCYSETECYGERYMLTTMNSNKDVILGGHNMLYDLNLIGINDLSNLSIESLSIENIAGSTWSVSTDRAIYYSSSSTTSTPEIELSKEVIYVKNRTIYLEESQSVSVFTVTGIVIFNGTASSIEIDQPGVYVVRTSRGVHKLVIS